MKKILLLSLGITPFILFAQSSTSLRQQKQQAKRDKINQLIKQEEEGVLIYRKQSAFSIKLNTDGYGIGYEHGKYKTVNKTNLWWIDLGERKNLKEEKITSMSQVFPGLALGNPFVYGKINNFYYLKGGIGAQKLLGGKGNKNGVAVSAIYGGGLVIGMLKPYYLEVKDKTTGADRDVKYSGSDTMYFINANYTVGAASFTEGFGEIKYVPGIHAHAALRFDYGRYTEILSALEVGLNAEYYTQSMPIMALNDAHKFFLNAYVAIMFGSRK